MSRQFSDSLYRPGNLIQLVEKEGFIVSEEINGGMLHQAFGFDEQYRMNTNYAKIFASSDKYTGKPMIGMTEAKGNSIEIPSHAFTFTLSGGTLQKARITQKTTLDTKPGFNNTEFEFVVDRPWFSVSDVVQPGTNRYRVLVVSNPNNPNKAYTKVGPNAYKYYGRLITQSPTEFLPVTYLEPGREWLQKSSAVAGEANPNGGGFAFYNVFENHGQVQQFAKQYSMTDKAMRKCLEAAERYKKGDESAYHNTSEMADGHKFLWTKMKDDNGQAKLFSMSLLDAKMNEALYCDVEDALVFGRKSSNNLSSEGYVIYTTSGWREQVEAGWVFEHNGNMSLREMETYFDMILRDRVASDKQKIVLECGREFRRMFDTMVKADSSSFLTLDTKFIRDGADFRHLDYGSYFSRYTGFTVTIDVMENVACDNPAYCPDKHPLYPNTPVDSWRADIMDFGNVSDENIAISGELRSNISMVSEKYMNYNINFNGKYYNPFSGGYAAGLPITDGGLGNLGQVSGFTAHREKSGGLIVVDATRCGVMRLAGTF